MDDGLISRRYAKAFLRYASRRRAAGLVYEKMKLFLENYHSHPDLRKTLQNPQLSPEDKEMLLSTSIGIEPEEAYLHAIRLLIKNHREKYLKTISLVYQRLYREAKGIVLVNVVTATEVGDTLLKEIEEVVRQQIKGKPEFVFTTDPSILGGFILITDSVQYDSSVRKELETIRKKLVSAN